MSLIRTDSWLQNNSPFRNRLFTRNTLSTTPATTGTQLSFPAGTTSVTVKLWGAGGAGGSAAGGGGGFTTYSFKPLPGSSYFISIGRAGVSAGFGTSSGGSILPGGTIQISVGGVGSGGDATCLISLKSGSYTLLAVAGGGGGAGGTYGGAGGGSSGQNGTPTFGGLGGSNGTGGSGPISSGFNCTLTSGTITGFGGGGNNGTSGSGNITSGGGGGYGGGGGGQSSNGSGGGGGLVNSSVSEYLSGSTTTGNQTTPAGTGDADYTGSVGVGGASSLNGNNGYAVIYYNAYNAVNFGNSYSESTATASSTVSSFNFVNIPSSVINSANSGVVFSNAASLYIDGPIQGGTNNSITNSYSLNINSGNSIFGSSSSVILQNSAASTNSTTGAIQSSGGGYFGAASIFNNGLSVNGTGSTGATTSPFLVNPTSTTAFSGSNVYYFSYFGTPTTSGSTSGSAYTIYINGAPAGATNSYSLYVNSGNCYFNGNTYATQLSVIGGGSTSSASAPLFVGSAGSTSFTASNNYYFTYFSAPTTSGSTNGSAYTIYINGAPPGATNSYSLYINGGASYFGASVTLNTSLQFSGQNTTTIASVTRFVAMNDNPIFLRTSGDRSHYLVYGNVSGNSFAGQSTDGPALVGFVGGILGCSTNNSWALKWDSGSGVVVNGLLTANGASSQTFSYGYLNSSGAVGIGNSTANYSILAANRIKASEFNAVSSKLLKQVIEPVDHAMPEIIELFKQIPLSKYEYIDKLKHDNYPHYGLIAEEMPDSIWVNKSETDYVPNIFCFGFVQSENGDKKILKLSKPIVDLEKITNTDSVKCFLNESELYKKEVICKKLEILEKDIIQIESKDFRLNETILVYGTKEMIPTIQKNSAFELGLCVIKNLLQRIEVLESQQKK